MLNSYIGQKEILEQTRIAIHSAKARGQPFPHCLMSGQPGLGKTMLARLIAKEMGARLVYRVASALTTTTDLSNLFEALLYDNTMIFLDEIEELGRKLSEPLHSVMEEQTLCTPKKFLRLPKITLIGATNYLGELPRPFVDRFKLQLPFEAYHKDEMFAILIQKIKEEKIRATRNGLKAIANRSRGVPRIGIRFLESARDVALTYPEYGGLMTEACVKRAFKILRVDDIGLTRLDMRILGYLRAINRPVGLTSLSQGVDEHPKTIESAEGYLIRLGLIAKSTRGRMITKEGIKHVDRHARGRNYIEHN